MAASRRGARGLRPAGPFDVNRGSAQARGLIHWVPVAGSDAVSGAFLSDDTARFGVPGLGLCASFGGAQRMVGAALPDLNGAAELTVSAWARADPYYNQFSYISSLEGVGAAGTPYWLRVSSGFLDFYAGGATASATEPAIGTLNLITGVYGGSNVYLYVNGIQVATAAASATTGTNALPIIIGDGNTYASRFWLGQISDHRIYSRALTASDVWALYDPATRWDLYAVPSRRAFFDVVAAAPVTGSKIIFRNVNYV